MASRVALTDSELPLVARALRHALADKSLARTDVCVYATLLLASHNGQVEGLSLEDLSKRAGVPRHQVERAVKQLSTVGRIQASQPRPYRPKVYLIPTLRSEDPGTSSSVGARVSQRSNADDRGCPRGSEASPVAPSSPSAADANRLLEIYGDNLSPDEVHECKTSPMDRLDCPLVCPAQVWYMLSNRPGGFSREKIYLGHILLTRVRKQSPPQDKDTWPELLEALRDHILSDVTAREQILEAIIEHPPVVHGTSLQADELAIFQEVCGEPCHA